MASSKWVSASSVLSPTASKDRAGLDIPVASQPQLHHSDARQSQALIHPYSTKVTGKRARAEGSRVAMSYPRKRAVAACKLCRARKRKCNNARPRCKFCEDSGADCVYGDPGDHSSFDPASLVMIDKLNHIIQRLDAQQIRFPDANYQEHTPGPFPNAQGFGEAPQSSQAQSFLQARGGDIEEFMEIPSSRTTADTILLWPIFEGRYPPEYLVDALFDTPSENLDAESGVSDEASQRLSGIKNGRPSFREDEVNELVERFMLYVHIKNPILDVVTLKRYARRVVEDGPSWDGGSCLVFLACALGALARPFPTPSNGTLPSVRNKLMFDSSTGSEKDLETAESNYSLAARRIGLLKNSILRSQCYFWSGVFLMYTLRPVEAWEKFFQASSTYHIYLKGRLAKNEQTDLYSSSTRLLEQRLYWSCFKSECEIRVDLNLPESSIARVQYPDMFPSPPNVETAVDSDVLPSPVSTDMASPSLLHQHDVQPHRNRSYSENQKNSWYYYLSEIALRRISNNVLNTFYANDQYPGSGISIEHMVKTATNFVDQMSQWYDGLPSAIKYNQEDFSDMPQDELVHVTRARALEIYTWLFRPFLYYVIHNSANDPHRAIVQGFVDSALKIARATMREGITYHRHHGTWFGLRSGISSAVSMVAAHKCGHIELPTDWREVVQIQISVLQFWEKESPDIAKARNMLTDMMME